MKALILILGLLLNFCLSMSISIQKVEPLNVLNNLTVTVKETVKVIEMEQEGDIPKVISVLCFLLFFVPDFRVVRSVSSLAP